MTDCLHVNAIITLYELTQTEYLLQNGKIAEAEDDFEPQPLKKVDVVCPDCPLKASYEDWRQAPEPIRSYCQQIFQQEYGVPDKGETSVEGSL